MTSGYEHPTGPVADGFAERIRAREEADLSPLATRSYPAPRRHPEPDCGLRTPFQRDRDRIVHCKAFRRLKHKTQVFVAPSGDHYRTRLTHTLEVTQISRTVARALALNEDLCEAIGLGHDLDAAPHAGGGEQDQRVGQILHQRPGRRADLHLVVRFAPVRHGVGDGGALGGHVGLGPALDVDGHSEPLTLVEPARARLQDGGEHPARGAVQVKGRRAEEGIGGELPREEGPAGRIALEPERGLRTVPAHRRR